ncbi:MAG: 50S ribosomal protein L13 [Patescibacteria group bacterium]|jgi:large subunit ribosomal protein L13
MAEIKNENRNWYLFDAKEQILGRLATEVASSLRGKRKVSFRENLDNGDYVVVVNAEKIVLTGSKEENKRYYRHTGYLGNLQVTTLKEMRKEHPGEIIKHAVAGMLPKNKLRDQFLKRLKIYTGSKHPHQNVKFAE